MAETRVYDVRYVHKTSPRADDRGPRRWSPPGPGRVLYATRDGIYLDLTQAELADATRLAGALRRYSVLAPNARVANHRVDADGTVTVFPVLPGSTTYWHAVILTPEGPGHPLDAARNMGLGRGRGSNKGSAASRRSSSGRPRSR